MVQRSYRDVVTRYAAEVRNGSNPEELSSRARVRMSPESRPCGPLPEIKIVMQVQALWAPPNWLTIVYEFTPQPRPLEE